MKKTSSVNTIICLHPKNKGVHPENRGAHTISMILLDYLIYNIDLYDKSRLLTFYELYILQCNQWRRG